MLFKVYMLDIYLNSIYIECKISVKMFIIVKKSQRDIWNNGKEEICKLIKLNNKYLYTP